MRIAVTTPNGHVGQHLSRMLIRAGTRPLLLTRHPDDIPSELHDFADRRHMDSLDVESVIAATEGVDVLYWVTPPSASDDPLDDYARAAHALTEAVARNAIPRVVLQSSVGAEKRHGVGEIDGLAATEIALEATRANITHLRCGYFFTNLLMDLDSIRSGTLRTVMPLDFPFAWVATHDIAEVAAMAVLNTSWHGRRVQAVHGPEDLTWNHVATVLSRALNKPVVAERVDDSTMLQTYLDAGLPPATASGLLGMSTGIRDDFPPEQPRTPQTTTETTLDEWVHAVLGPALSA